MDCMDQDPVPVAPLEPGDWYFDGPNIVFTEQYLLKRGKCCESGCRHCPYGFTRKQRPGQPA